MNHYLQKCFITEVNIKLFMAGCTEMDFISMISSYIMSSVIKYDIRNNKDRERTTHYKSLFKQVCGQGKKKDFNVHVQKQMFPKNF